MPFFVFIRSSHGSSAWELLEAVNVRRVAEQAFHTYRRLQSQQPLAEVVMIEADTLAQANEQLVARNEAAN